MIKTKIKVRPFIPYIKDEEIEGREPFATLTYGDITIELDYTIMRMLSIDNRSHIMFNTIGLAHGAFNEIIKEMDYHIYGKLPNTHRDGDHPILKAIDKNPLHPINEKHVHYSKIE